MGIFIITFLNLLFNEPNLLQLLIVLFLCSYFNVIMSLNYYHSFILSSSTKIKMITEICIGFVFIDFYSEINWNITKGISDIPAKSTCYETQKFQENVVETKV